MSRLLTCLTLIAALSLPSLAQAETLSASELFAIYERNEIVAEDSYNGRRIDISGRISALKQAMMGAPIVLLEAGSSNKLVSCHFPKKAQTELAGLKVGDQVSFSCRIKYRMGNTIHASACSLE
ncbi:OB-fold protein [Halochromatium sp.]